MENNVTEILRSVFSDVLENFAFMFCEIPEPDEFKLVENEFVYASIQFDGPEKGSLYLASTMEFCTRLSSDILGEENDEDIVKASAQDSFKELLNVTCGEFLEALSGSEVIYNLTVPEFKTISSGDMKALAEKEGIVKLNVDELPVITYCEIN